MVDHHRTEAVFDLYKELNCVHGCSRNDKVLTIDEWDEEKMMARALDCLASVCEAQTMRVVLKRLLKLQVDGDVLTSEQQAQTEFD